MNKSEKIFLTSLIVAAVAVGAFAIVKFDSKNDYCVKLGGILVKTAEGWDCVRLEKLT